MGVCCQSSPDAGRGGNNIKMPAETDSKVDLKKRGSIRPSVAHRDKKLVRDYTLGIQLGQGAYGEVRECAHK